MTNDNQQSTKTFSNQNLASQSNTQVETNISNPIPAKDNNSAGVPTNEDESDSGMNLGKIKAANLNSKKVNSDTGDRKNNIIAKRTSPSIPIPDILDSIQTQNELKQKISISKASEKKPIQKVSENYFNFLEPIAMIEPKQSLLQNEERNFQPFLLASEKVTPETKSFYLSIENSFGVNNIRQHALSFGKYFRLKNNFGVNVQVGGRLDVGFSFSQDSVLILRGLSIEERRQDKDLKNTWNAFLDLNVFHRKDNWRFGIGFRGGYSLINQFYFVESTRIKHLGTFNNSVSEINERADNDTWSGINRISFDGYLNVTYQVDTNYSFGLLVGKRLNTLIEKEMANQAYSNTPLRFGVIINKHF